VLDEIVARYYPTAGERAEAASRLRHEIARRQRRAVMSSRTLKVCPTCNTAKPHADFHRHAGRPDGLQWQCRGCAAAGTGSGSF
jgi:hypothetical protein